MVGVSSAGASTQPTRQPVALAVFETALTTHVRSAIPGSVARLMWPPSRPARLTLPPPPAASKIMCS